MGPEILSSTGTGVWRKAPKAFPFVQFCTGRISVCDNTLDVHSFSLELETGTGVLPILADKSPMLAEN